MQAIIQTPTPHLKKSIGYYNKLGFTRIENKLNPLFSDGTSLIEINPDRFARAGVKLYQKDWNNDLIAALSKMAKVSTITNGYKLCDPSGTWIYLLNSKQESNIDLKSIQPSTLGNNAGISIETPNINMSIDIWRLVGFTSQQGDAAKGWVSLTNQQKFTISLMNPETCPHLFYNPSLTFFNGENNLKVIEKIRLLKIPITEEITHFNKEGKVDNIIIRDPGGLGFFLFSD